MGGIFRLLLPFFPFQRSQLPLCSFYTGGILGAVYLIYFHQPTPHRNGLLQIFFSAVVVPPQSPRFAGIGLCDKILYLGPALFLRQSLGELERLIKSASSLFRGLGRKRFPQLDPALQQPTGGLERAVFLPFASPYLQRLR